MKIPEIITDEEILIRIVFTPSSYNIPANIILPAAFQVRKDQNEGYISLFRELYRPIGKISYEKMKGFQPNDKPVGYLTIQAKNCLEASTDNISVTLSIPNNNNKSHVGMYYNPISSEDNLAENEDLLDVIQNLITFSTFHQLPNKTPNT